MPENHLKNFRALRERILNVVTHILRIKRILLALLKVRGSIPGWSCVTGSASPSFLRYYSESLLLVESGGPHALDADKDCSLTVMSY